MDNTYEIINNKGRIVEVRARNFGFWGVSVRIKTHLDRTKQQIYALGFQENHAI